MNITYLIYQAERQLTVAEQREANLRAGELAAAIARAGRTVKAAVTLRIGGSRPQRPIIPGDDLIIPVATSRR
jgi:hypothetical protein